MAVPSPRALREPRHCSGNSLSEKRAVAARLAMAVSVITGITPLMPAIRYIGTATTSDNTTRATCSRARSRSLRAPFNMAVSPPVRARAATVGASAITCHVCPSPPNVCPASSGDAATHTAAPATAATMLHARTVFTNSCMRRLSPLSNISDRCFTALNDMPRLVACDTKLEMVFRSDASPMPAGPSIRATSLLRTRPMRMFSPCTPPNTPVYFSTCAYSSCVFSASFITDINGLCAVLLQCRATTFGLHCCLLAKKYLHFRAVLLSFLVIFAS